MIKYLGSKRRLAPVLGDLAVASGARHSCRPLHRHHPRRTGAQASRAARHGVRLGPLQRGVRPVLRRGRCRRGRRRRLADAALGELSALDGRFATSPRRSAGHVLVFDPDNGERIDAIRDGIADRYVGHPLEPMLLTSLIEAADRVDSTTGVQMAYVKQWAPRALRPLELRRPVLVAGLGERRCGVMPSRSHGRSGRFDLAYLDPPYNQHRYFTNYHVWETLVAWDAPEHYGVACKRIDARDPATRSAFNRRRRDAGRASRRRAGPRRRRCRHPLVQRRGVVRPR